MVPPRARTAFAAAGSTADSIRHRTGTHLQMLLASFMLLVLVSGCGHFSDASRATASFAEANSHFSQGNYQASLKTYQQIVESYPAAADRGLFEMGIIYAHPGNEQKDYQKSRDSFQKLVREYPESIYHKDSEVMIFNLGSVIAKDRTITAQQTQIEALRSELQGRGAEIAELHKKIVTLEQELKNRENEIQTLKKEAVVILKGKADKILIEKNDRRLTLFSKGKVLKTYPIALGGNPSGPKERQGDNKTPEGNYTIDSRNRNSRFHLALHISYPNEKDKKRARELGVSPGGDIMIHGIKNGLSWVGEMHTEIDWTQGCIAVTDEEIEEIEKLVPNGTAVEIRP